MRHAFARADSALGVHLVDKAPRASDSAFMRAAAARDIDLSGVPPAGAPMLQNIDEHFAAGAAPLFVVSDGTRPGGKSGYILEAVAPGSFGATMAPMAPLVAGPLGCVLLWVLPAYAQGVPLCHLSVYTRCAL